MVEGRVTSQEPLESDDYLVDGKDGARGDYIIEQKQSATHNASDVEGMTVGEYLFQRHRMLRSQPIPNGLPRSKERDWRLYGGPLLFDLPAYATHKNPWVAQQLGKFLDVNKQYNISCQIWDDDFLEEDYIGTSYYGNGLFVSEDGDTIPEWGASASIMEMAAAQNHNPEFIGELIAAGGVINTDAMLLAVKYNHNKVIRYLIENGANVNACSRGGKFPEGTTPVQVAVQRGQGHLFEELVKAGAKYKKNEIRQLIAEESEKRGEEGEDFEERFVASLSPEMRQELGYPKRSIGIRWTLPKTYHDDSDTNTNRTLSQNSQQVDNAQTVQPKDNSR